MLRAVSAAKAPTVYLLPLWPHILPNMHHYGQEVAELVSILPLASDLAGTQPKLAESCTDGKLEELGPFAVVEGKAR